MHSAAWRSQNQQYQIAALVVILMLTVDTPSRGQGTFENLDFELANLPVLPPGQWEFVSSASALPGWTCYLGTNLVSQATHNSITVGAANVGVLGPSFSPSIGGQFTAVLQDGGSPADTRIIVSASITQTAVVPAGIQSIRLKTSPGLNPSYFAVALAGQVVSVFPLATTSAYTLFGGDVSAYAGQAAELRVSSLSVDYARNSGFLLDDIVFSNQPVPEPSVMGMFILGGLVFLCRSRQNHRA